MTVFILVCYFGILTVLCVYGGHRLHITHMFRKFAKDAGPPQRKFDELPVVTVQLPLFNEKFVVQRLIDAIAAIDYPKDKLQIQVLDDSTDETTTIAADRVAYHRCLGLDIELIHRKDRSGFKAGALANGLESAKGQFIAIFDADFIPQANVLMEIIHYFTDPSLGMVQARWGHLNRGFNTLTEVQAIMLDAHFMIEHGGRCYSGRYFNFNGTAGIWRRTAITDAGGWQLDTLTEDLDLSYRAQLKGWRFLFLPGIVCPAELPTEMLAFKSQQHRWAKGSIQVMKKLLPQIWKSDSPAKVKWEATFHLTGNLAYLLMVINSLFFVIPSMVVRGHQEWWLILVIDGPLFVMASLSFVQFYLASQFAIFRSTKGRKRFIPALMAIGIGLGINNARAVLEALMGKQSDFVRTPKTGNLGGKSRPVTTYRLGSTGWGLLEVAMGFMYTLAILWAIRGGVWASIPFLVLFQNGFYFIGFLTLRESWSRRTMTQLSSKPSLPVA